MYLYALPLTWLSSQYLYLETKFLKMISVLKDGTVLFWLHAFLDIWLEVKGNCELSQKVVAFSQFFCLQQKKIDWCLMISLQVLWRTFF